MKPARAVSIFRGTLWLAGSSDEAFAAQNLPRFAPTRWLERTFAALPSSEPARFVAVRYVCQTASGGSFFAMLGGTHTPHAEPALRVRVGVCDASPRGLPSDVGAVVLARMSEVLAAHEALPAGELVVDHALFHEVDTKEHAWRSCAALTATLLVHPQAHALTDAELEALWTACRTHRG